MDSYSTQNVVTTRQRALRKQFIQQRTRTVQDLTSVALKGQSLDHHIPNKQLHLGMPCRSAGERNIRARFGKTN